jgi:hypothetical protein
MTCNCNDPHRLLVLNIRDYETPGGWCICNGICLRRVVTIVFIKFSTFFGSTTKKKPSP